MNIDTQRKTLKETLISIISNSDIDTEHKGYRLDSIIDLGFKLELIKCDLIQPLMNASIVECDFSYYFFKDEKLLRELIAKI